MAATSGMHVLIVEDSQADAKLMQLWFGRSSAIGSIAIVSEGRKALEYVRGEAEFRGREPPDIVLLDSNLPDMVGIDVLAELRREPHSGIDVFVLSGTYNAVDARRAQELGAVGYLVKPLDVDEFAALVQRIEEHGARRQRKS